MADKKQIARQKQDLVTLLAQSRTAITREKALIKEKLQVKKQLSKFLKEKPKSIFAGSAIAGLGAALFLRHKPRKQIAKKTRHLTPKTMLLSWVLTLLKPAVKAWVISRAKGLASKHPTK